MKCYSVVLIVIVIVLALLSVFSVFSVNPPVCIAGNITDEDYYFKEGLNYLSSDQYFQALDSFKKVIEINPNSEKAYAFSGTIYHILGLPAKAIDSYKEAIKINPSFLEVHYQLGLLYRDMGKYDNAIESFNKAIQIDPYYHFAYFNLGTAYELSGQKDKAIEFYQKTIGIKPDFADAYNYLGNIYSDKSEYEKAIESYQKAIELAPDNAWYHHNIGLSYGKFNNFKKATEHLEKAVKLNPDLIDTHMLLATSYGGSLGQYEDAIRAYKEVIRLNPNNADAYYGIGLTYSILKQHREAKEAFEHAIKLKPDFAEAHYSLGLAYSDLKESGKAIKAYAEAINLKPDFVDTHYMLGLTYGSLSQYEKAIESFKKVIKLKPDHFDAYYFLGLNYYDLGQIEKAIDYLNKSLKINPNNEQAHETLAEYYFLAGKLSKANEHFETVLKHYRTSSDKEGLAKSLLFIGEIMMQQGKDVYALNKFQEALSIYEELNNEVGEAVSLNDIALIYHQLRDFNTALRHFYKALHIFEKLKDTGSIVRILGCIALVKLSMAHELSSGYEEVIEEGKRAIEIAQTFGNTNTENLFYAYFAVGSSYWFLEDYENAIKHGELFLKDIGEKTKLKNITAFSNIALGFALEKLQKNEEAKIHYQKASEIINHLDNPSMRWLLLWGLGRINEQEGNFIEAQDKYLQAIEILEEHRGVAQSLALKISMGVQAKTVYEDTILFLLKSNKESDAFYYMERARGRTFLELLGNKFNISDKDINYKNIIEKERRLLFQIHAIEEKLDSLYENSDEKKKEGLEKTLKRELEQARKEHIELIENIKKNKSELSMLLTVNSLTLKEVQELLEGDTTLLEYFITPDKILLWVVGKSDLKVVEIALKDKELTKKVNTYREKITTLQLDYEKNSRELYDLLIKPAKPYIKTKRVGIVPHAILHYLPFQALLGENGKYFIEEFDLFFSPSASVLKFVYEKRKEIKGKILAFGNPKLDDEKLDLPYSEDEVKKIKSTYPETVVFIKGKATEDRAKKFSGEYDIIHFASHGELNSASPMASNIRLVRDKDEDGRLEVNEIFNLNLKNTSLVTLSACETGLGEFTKGDELIGLTRGFIYAGTPSIVASLWKVNDQSTSEFMNLFYRNLKSYPKSEALRMAQLEMIRGKTGKGIVRGVGGITISKEGKSKQESTMTVDGSHPYFWAPFILVGDWK